MADILEQIVEHKRQELVAMKKQQPLRHLLELVDILGPCQQPSMRQALMASGNGIIAEFKRKSPSRGWINEPARPRLVPLSYQQNGAAALSILTDEYYFGGRDEFIVEARRSGVTAPILYKNFVIDEYQLLQARLCGASAVLLIAACLSQRECNDLLHKAHDLGLEVLLEMHNDRDFEYASLGPDMYGINNRNLGSFVTDVDNSFRLASQLPAGVCKVSESGISDPRTVAQLRQQGFHGFLIGETFMKTSDPGQALHNFINQL